LILLTTLLPAWSWKVSLLLSVTEAQLVKVAHKIADATIADKKILFS